MHNAALRRASLALRYESLDVSVHNLPDVMRQARSDRWAGNITIPHKMSACAYVDTCTEEARFVGAVNTFWVNGDVLVGDNTDVAGFDRACDVLGTPKANARVACIGAGGAAAAVCAAVTRWPGASARILARRREAARSLASRFSECASAATTQDALLEEATLIVNCTPVGLQGDALPIPVEGIPPDADVMDLVYRRGETPFVHAARARGHRATDGLEMLIQQGALSFEIWVDQKPDVEAMREALSGQPTES